MSAKLTHREVVSHIAKDTGLPEYQVFGVLNSIGNLVANTALAGGRISIDSLGTFYARRFAERTRPNPNTGEKELIPSRQFLKIKGARAVTRLLNPETY